MASPEHASKMIMNAAAAAPYLRKEEEYDLAQRWAQNDDQQALHQLTMAHMRLVIALAVKFRHYGLPVAELVQEGHVGLLEAASRFEPERGVRFSTYATWWIRASIQDYVLRNWSIVRGGTSSGQKALFFKLRRLRAEIAKVNPDRNSREIFKELSLALGVSEKDVANMDAWLSGPHMSLNAPVSDEGEGSAERQDFLESDDLTPHDNAESSIDGERKTRWLTKAIATLNERERSIIKRRRLTDDVATLDELGNEMGISKERVRQIEVKALEKLRTALLEINPEFAGLAS